MQFGAQEVFLFGVDMLRYMFLSSKKEGSCFFMWSGGDIYNTNDKILFSEISCMTHIPLAGLLVTGSDDGAVRFWNPASGSTIMLKHHTNTVSCMTMAHLQRNHFLITAGYDGKVGFWDVTKRTRSVKPRIENIFQAHHGRQMTFGGTSALSHTVDEEILCIVYHEVDPEEQKRVFLTGGNDSKIRIWNGRNSLFVRHICIFILLDVLLFAFNLYIFFVFCF